MIDRPPTRDGPGFATWTSGERGLTIHWRVYGSQLTCSRCGSELVATLWHEKVGRIVDACVGSPGAFDVAAFTVLLGWLDRGSS